MSHGDTIPLHPSSQSDIDEIENLINASVQSGPATVLPARPPSPPRASIPVSSSPFMASNLPPPPYQKAPVSPVVPPPPAVLPVSDSRAGGRQSTGATGFGPPPNTLTEPVWETVRRDLLRIVSNLKLVVFPNPFREDPGKALRDWDLWGPFFFIIFLGLTLSWSASVKKETRSAFIHSRNRGVQPRQRAMHSVPGETREQTPFFRYKKSHGKPDSHETAGTKNPNRCRTSLTASRREKVPSDISNANTNNWDQRHKDGELDSHFRTSKLPVELRTAPEKKPSMLPVELPAAPEKKSSNRKGRPFLEETKPPTNEGEAKLPPTGGGHHHDDDDDNKAGGGGSA
ncbi:hypothetical protein Taro_031481 [Colocasia esculenta]|uniref:Uncharacterized protein n=1 Tax=Colocasia esculenta TaxID=4460 RepID=A0A843VWT4_COLES|nr:hypothetical protein [Colocasia esculenta]